MTQDTPQWKLKHLLNQRIELESKQTSVYFSFNRNSEGEIVSAIAIKDLLDINKKEIDAVLLEIDQENASALHKWLS